MASIRHDYGSRGDSLSLLRDRARLLRSARATANTTTSGPRKAPVKISVIHPGDLGAPELAAWRTMQRSTPELAHPFLAPGFVQAAGRARTDARVAILEEGPNIVGFFPFERRRFRIGGAIAAGVSDRQAVIHVPELEWNVRQLLAGCGLDVWEFDHLVASQTAAAGQHITRRSSPIIDVSGGYQPYLEERLHSSKKTLKAIFYKERKLERDLGPIRFELDVTDPKPLALLMQWKSAQYRRTGRRDRFAIGWIQRLVLDLFETRSEACVGMLSVLYAADRLVAVHLGLRSDSALACWFPAYDISLASYSPGLMLHLKMAEAAAQDGVRYLDLGKGGEEYKHSLKSGDLSVGEGWTERPSAVALLRRGQRTPRRVIFHTLSRHPMLRQQARRVLKQFGSIRSST